MRKVSPETSMRDISTTGPGERGQYSLFASALDYRETPLHPDWPVRLNCQRGVEQIADSPNPICDPQRNARRGPQRLVNAA
jgi:hypothetical protein